MSKKEATNPKENGNQNNEAKKMNNSEISNKKGIKPPMVGRVVIHANRIARKITAKNIKNQKRSKELIKNDKKAVLTFIFVITILAYFYQ